MMRFAMDESFLRRAPCFAVVMFLLPGAAPGMSQAPSTEQYERNWPQWRGPLANGLVPHGDPPLTWSETRNIKWKIALEGLGHATPIIWDNKIFVLSAVPDSSGHRLAFTVFCYDKVTGVL